jgi:hypothetical protein
VRQATIFWSLVLFVAGIVQVALAFGTGLAVASPTGFLTRSLVALFVEAAGFVYVRRTGTRKPNS